MMSSPIAHWIRRGLAAVACLAVTSSCAGDVAKSGKSPTYLVIDVLEGVSGVPGIGAGTQLNSDVLTIVEVTIGGAVTRVPTIFNDLGRVTLSAQLKNPGVSALPTEATPVNSVTISRYRVVFKRTDGRNEPGRDVPYGFDGGVTGTVLVGSRTTLNFDLVRHTNKEEPPLRNMVNLGGQVQINTIAEITFYGRDQGGNDVTVTGMITVNFADFGDPA